MTFLETTAPSIWMVDTPLNEQFTEFEENDLIKVGYRDIYRGLPVELMQQRMFMILLLVTAVIIVFALLLLPSWLSQDGVPDTAVVSNNTNTVQSESESIPLALSNQSGAISSVFSPEVQNWAPQITAWAAAFNLDPNMVATIMQIESCGDPQAISSAGAQGLFQVMPFHFTAGEEMLNPETNAMRGMAYFSERLQQTSGDVGKAFAGYNGGHVAAGTTWDNWANETQRYFTWSTGIYEDASSGLASSPTLQQWLAAGGASLCQQAANRLR